MQLVDTAIQLENGNRVVFISIRNKWIITTMDEFGGRVVMKTQRGKVRWFDNQQEAIDYALDN
jgi:hypothetical protein